MSRFSLVALPCVVLAGCGDPGLVDSLTTPLTIEVRLAVDTLVPGDPVASTWVIRNRQGGTVSFTGNTCTLGMDILRADGTVVPEVQSCRDVAKTWTIPGHDSLVMTGPWDATYLAPGSTSATVTALPPGAYGLRPWIHASELDVVGAVTAVTVLPWVRARLAHSGTGLPRLDLVVGGRVAASQIEVGFVGGGGIVPAGRQTVALRVRDQATPVAVEELVLPQGSAQTIAVRVLAGGGFEPWLLADSNTVTGPNQSRFRVIHLAAAAPPIDVYRTQPDWPSFVRVMFPFAYGAASPYLLSDAGPWRVLVTPEGGTDTLLLTAPMPIAGGLTRTLILMDDGAGGLTASLIEP